MRFIADLHIHSHYSLATSKQLEPRSLDAWARLKGIDVVGTGDCIHPGYFGELRQTLVSADNGLFTIKGLKKRSTSFILTTEISSIYKIKGKVRKVHNICFFPDFKSVKHVQTRLAKIGNIDSDGRPILGLDARDLLEIVLESDPRSFLIPAHIWTPWFSVLGAKSGFDTIEECFRDLTNEIFALETGLSSDPQMNRLCSFLDSFRLVSNSDAHSPSKLGREANIFETELSYNGIYNALKYDNGFLGTIEFFPQEGKYHFDGHRECGIALDPYASKAHNGICPVCGKALTMGVATRVVALADRERPDNFGKQTFYSVTPLSEIIAEYMQVKNTASKKVEKEYARLIREIGPEFNVLLFAEYDKIKNVVGERFAEGIRRLRAGIVSITSGYDGQFGEIRIF
ncbi:MAG: DNA helicase UvrD [Candidatus Omnitrophica bacterium]|nr:DNA helicase UvrD [Candidatus Omnitrophota bacterium]